MTHPTPSPCCCGSLPQEILMFFFRKVIIFPLAFAIAATAATGQSPTLTLKTIGSPQPGTRFYGITADEHLTHIAYAVKEKDAMYVMKDDEKGPVFDAIRKGTPLFGPSGHLFVYVGYKGDMGHVMVNGKEEGVFDGVDGFQFSRDGKHLCYRVENREKQQAVVVNGTPLGFYEEIAPETLTLSPAGGGVSYAARQKDNTWQLTQNTESLGRFDRVLSIRYSGDGNHLFAIVLQDQHFFLTKNGTPITKGYDGIQSLTVPEHGSRVACVVQKKGKLAVWTDGKPGRFYSTVGPPVFAKDGTKIAYPVQDRNQWRMVLNDKAMQRHDQIGPPVFSESGLHVAWLAIDGKKSRFIFNGKPREAFDAVDGFLFGPLGHHAYRAKRKGKWFLVVDDTPGPPHDAVTPPLFHETGRVLYSATDQGRHRLFVDGVAGPPADAISPPVFSPAGHHVGCAVRIKDTWFVDIDGNRLPVAATAFLNREPVRFRSETRLQGLAYRMPGPRFVRVTVAMDPPRPEGAVPVTPPS